MKLTNTSGKIISVGKVVILPGQTAEIADDRFADSPSVKHLVKLGFLAEAEQEAPKAAQTAKAAKKTIKLENGKAA